MLHLPMNSTLINAWLTKTMMCTCLVWKNLEKDEEVSSDHNVTSRIARLPSAPQVIPPVVQPVVENPVDEANHQRVTLPSELWGSPAVEEATNNSYCNANSKVGLKIFIKNEGVYLGEK
jgi:hypothetical protein